jgi:sulfur relay (sulfurtransferase) DsrF/TusC family protein
MVIEVSYQNSNDSKDIHSHFKQTKYFDVDQMPDRNTVAQKLKNMGLDFDETTISIEPYDEDAQVMRKDNIAVLKF